MFGEGEDLQKSRIFFCREIGCKSFGNSFGKSDFNKVRTGDGIDKS